MQYMCIFISILKSKNVELFCKAQCPVMQTLTAFCSPESCHDQIKFYQCNYVPGLREIAGTIVTITFTVGSGNYY